MKINLNVSKIEEIDKIRYIKELSSLCNAANAQKFIMAHLEAIVDDIDSPKAIRSRVYGLVMMSSYTYETVLLLYSILKKIGTNLSSTTQNHFNWLNREIKIDQNSFFKKVLEPIRNNLGFHFNPNSAPNRFSDGIGGFPPLFAEYSKPDMSDIVFKLPTEIITTYIASFDENPSDYENSTIRMVVKLGEYGDKVEKILIDSIFQILDLNPGILAYGKDAH